MVMFGAPLVDSLGVPHVFRVCIWFKVSCPYTIVDFQGFLLGHVLSFGLLVFLVCGCFVICLLCNPVSSLGLRVLELGLSSPFLFCAFCL